MCCIISWGWIKGGGDRLKCQICQGNERSTRLGFFWVFFAHQTCTQRTSANAPSHYQITFLFFSFAPFMHAHLQTLLLTVLPDGLQLLTTNVLTHHQEVNMFGSFLCRKISLPDISLAEQWHLCRQTLEKHCHYIIKLHGHEFEHDIKYCIRLYRQTLYVTEKEILVKYIVYKGKYMLFFFFFPLISKFSSVFFFFFKL